MKTSTELSRNVIDHLSEARRTMAMLMSVSGDWTAKSSVELEFDAVEKSVRDFCCHQLAVSNMDFPRQT